MQGKKQIVDIHPQEGICNRVIKLALALRHNADMSQPVYYNWRRNGYSMVKKRFYELFEFAYEDYEVIEINRDFGTDDIWGSDWVNDGEYRNLARYYGARILDIVDGEVVEWNEESKGSIDKGLVYEAPLQLLNYYIPFFQALKPSKEVLARISQVKEKEYVSVHVRLNDIWKIWGLGSDKDLENYFSEMRCYPEGTAFFLACADRGVAERFKIEFLPGGGIEL